MTTSLPKMILTSLLALVLAAAAVPSWADEGEEVIGDEARTEHLEMDVSPAIAEIGEPVEVEVEVEDHSDDEDYDSDSDDDGDDDSDEDSGDDDADDEDSGDEDADEHAGDDDADDEDSGDEDADEDAGDDDADDEDSGDDDADEDAGDEDSGDEDSDDDDSDDDDSGDDDSGDDDGDGGDSAGVGGATAATAGDGDEDDDDGDDDGSIAISDVVVDWGDGTVEGLPLVDEEKAKGEHVYAAAGAYIATVTATLVDGTVEEAQLVVQVGGGRARIDGDTRHDTAIQISQEEFSDGEAPAVLLARADAFADALAAAPLAQREDAPILLTDTAQVPAQVITEIDRVLADGGTVYLLGGVAAIDDAVAQSLRALGYGVVRIAGDDRIDTALRIAAFLTDAGVDVDDVVLAAAGSFPDALSGGAYAAGADEPVLLTGPDALDPRVREFLVGLGDVEVLVPGGEGTVSDAVLDEVRALGLEVTRISGDDRFETSAAIAEELFAEVDTVLIATGLNFPDALAGGAQAGRLGAPVLLVGEELPGPVAEFLSAHRGTIDTVYVLGGTAAIPQSVMDAIEAILDQP